jgi:hypothetical protein
MTDDEPRQQAFSTDMGVDNLADNPLIRMCIRNLPMTEVRKNTRP